MFTGGVGEHAPEVRAAATDGLAVGDVLVIEAREDLEIARLVRQRAPGEEEVGAALRS